jgi:hypothetical protein
MPLHERAVHAAGLLHDVRRFVRHGGGVGL